MNKYVRMLRDRIRESIHKPPQSDVEAAQGDINFLRETVRSESLRLDGDTCPVCDSHVSFIKVSVSNSMVRYLAALVREYERVPRFYHHRDLFSAGEKASTNGTRWTHWGLIEKSRDKGYYRPTQDGIDFIDGKLAIPKYVILFRNEPVEFADRHVVISECVNFRKWEV